MKLISEQLSVSRSASEIAEKLAPVYTCRSCDTGGFLIAVSRSASLCGGFQNEFFVELGDRAGHGTGFVT
jgi:hypothetical protein